MRSEVKLIDLVRELSVNMNAVEQWLKRDYIPVELRQEGRGRAVRVPAENVERLAIFLVIASMIGPTAAIAEMEEIRGNESSIEIRAACVIAKIDLQPVRAAILRAERK